MKLYMKERFQLSSNLQQRKQEGLNMSRPTLLLYLYVSGDFFGVFPQLVTAT